MSEDAPGVGARHDTEKPAGERDTGAVGDPGWCIRANSASVVARQLSSVVHEVNNALHIIHGNAELLETPAMPESVQRRARVVGEQTLRASALLSELHSFARPTSGPATDLSFGTVIEKALLYRRHALAKQHVRVTTAIEQPLRMFGCEWELRLAVLNMLMNAEQALASAPNPQLDVRAASHHGAEGRHWARLTLTDNGSGMATAERPGAGPHRLGLGSTVCSWVAERHAGRMSWEDAPGGGAVVRLEVPLLA